MADELASYLSRLKFDPKLWNSIQAKYLTNFRIVLLLIISIFLIGIVNFFDIPRRLNPEVDIPIIMVNTVLPGATPEDIEALITIPLEDKLKSIEDIDIMTSTSQNNSSSIFLQFLSTVETDKARNDVQEAVDTVTDLPEDATTPVVQALDFENAPVWTFALSSSDVPSLMRISKNLQDAIEDLPQVSTVQVSGRINQEIQVLMDPAKANEFNISPLQLSQALRSSASSYPAGSIETKGTTLSLSIDSEIRTIDDIRNIRITSGEKVITLNDIAIVQEAPTTNQSQTLYADSSIEAQPAVQFFVYKTSSADIDEASEEVVTAVEEYLKPYGDRIQLINITNTGELITEQFDDLLAEFGTTILLIFAVLLVFLGLRQAIIASLTVPLTFLSAIAIANGFGQSLNFLTLFSFLIALGLLIDDTIVIVSAMTRYYSTGKFTPAETGILVWRDFIVPIWSTTITTIWSFVPLLLATGIIGEFIKPIPIIITATMLSSTSIAVLITIPLMMVFLKLDFPKRVRILLSVLSMILVAALVYFILPKNIYMLPATLVIILIGIILYVNRELYKNRISKWYSSQKILQKYVNKGRYIVDNGVVNTEKLSLVYMDTIEKVLDNSGYRRGVIGFLIIFALVSYLLVPLGLVKNEFFPKTDEDTMYISVDLGEGTGIVETSAEARRFLNEVRSMPDIERVVAESGYKFNANFERENDPNALLLTLTLLEDREQTSIEIANKLRNTFKDYNRGELSVIELSGGPPAGADLQITLLGDELGTLDGYANTIVSYLDRQPGVIDPEKSLTSGTSKIVFIPDATKLAETGITRDTLSLWLRTYANGFTLDSIRFDEERDVNFRLSSKNVTPEELSELYIQSPGGNIPLLSLGTLKLDNNPTRIAREDTKRSLSISASVAQGYNITEVNADLEEFTNSLDLPAGYSWKTGGVNEENQRSVNSIIQAMGLSFVLILATMIIEFGSYRQAAIVMLSIPLAISGVFYIFGLTGTPLSFPALIGILALFGIVVTNAIVVVEKINSNRKDGMGLKQSIVDASGSRLEPVLLTSLTTIFGLLPITLSDPLWRGLGGAIIAGLFFSGMIKLFFVPVIYYNWYKDSK